tara:strand:- start:975 stop:1403 length:429 start_codon:yes stop_codon:yes gene_type:complete
VTDDNREACLALTLESHQNAFIPDVATSLEMAAKYVDTRPLVIYNNKNEVVGFAQYGVDEETGEWKIYRLMIDAAHQGQGLDTATTRELIETLKTQHSAAAILLCYHENNQIARNLYRKFDFQEYGKDGTKILARLDLIDCK